MKVSALRIENFKGLSSLECSFSADTGPRPFTLLLGDNGSGKTTVLQALALVLSLATRSTADLTTFRWPGFLPERIGSLGETRVELDVVFSRDELDAIGRVYRLWRDTAGPSDRSDADRIPEPAQSEHVKLILEHGRVRAAGAPGELSQFLGRDLVRQRLRTIPDMRRHLREIGDAFWFSQSRDLVSAGDARDGAELSPGSSSGIDRLRDFLVGWWAFHTSPEQVKSRGIDYLAELEPRFAELFPGTRFVGVAPREYASLTRATESYFLLERDGRVYDLAEMSSGEQAVFPLLYQFVRLGIARSVVLVDELELHLHPPEQQRLLYALRRIGPDCQFIVSSHSPYLEQITPSEDEIRLPGGRPCL